MQCMPAHDAVILLLVNPTKQTSKGTSRHSRPLANLTTIRIQQKIVGSTN